MLMLARDSLVIESVEPLEGHEGTIVTLRGSGFARHIRNNCVVVGGMAACARAERDSTATELKVRIGPVARAASGDILAWPGVGADLHTEALDVERTTLQFSEVAIFRNGAPVAAAGVDFKLTEVSPDTYAGTFERSAPPHVELGRHSKGAVMRVRFPKDLGIREHSTVDICLVLKEPTLAVDFSAVISRPDDDEQVLNAIARSIAVNASLVGEEVYADVARDAGTGDIELYVTKPHLLSGMLVVHFGSA
jgi:hypothetical protein